MNMNAMGFGWALAFFLIMEVLILFEGLKRRPEKGSFF